MKLFDQEFCHLNPEDLLQDLETLEKEGSIDAQFFQEDTQDFRRCRIRFSPGEIVAYVNAALAYDEFLGYCEDTGDPIAALDQISDVKIRNRVLEYNHWAESIGQHDMCYCFAAFAGDDLEDLICGGQKERYEFLAHVISEISEVQRILKVDSQKFAKLIAKDPNNLEELEWRYLEHTIAEIFDGLGFDVTLTPSSKDGGKDVVLEFWTQGRPQSYIVEIKHWRSRSRVGGKNLRDFLNVIIRERRNGGLFLSTYGFCDNALEQLTEIERQRLKFGEQEKIVALSRTYVKAKSGIWSPPENLAEVLFEDTL